MFAIEGLSNILEKIVPYKKEWATTYIENNKNFNNFMEIRDELLESHIDKIYLHPGVKWILLIFICILIGIFILIFLNIKKKEKENQDEN